MKIIRLTEYHTDENCYLIVNGKEAFVVDPGIAAEKVIEAAKNEDAIIKNILITHCHYDHIMGLEDLREKTGAKLIASEIADAHAQNPIFNLSSRFQNKIETKPAEYLIKDNEVINICGLSVKCIYTPGHTSGSVCFLCENHLFSGDTLFLREVGRWDLPSGKEEDLKKSIKEKLYKLDDDTIVHPGHGDDTSIGYEKKYNFYVKE